MSREGSDNPPYNTTEASAFTELLLYVSRCAECFTPQGLLRVVPGLSPFYLDGCGAAYRVTELICGGVGNPARACPFCTVLLLPQASAKITASRLTPPPRPPPPLS